MHFQYNPRGVVSVYVGNVNMVLYQKDYTEYVSNICNKGWMYVHEPSI